MYHDVSWFWKFHGLQVYEVTMTRHNRLILILATSDTDSRERKHGY